jgi:hypothetical protein
VNERRKICVYPRKYLLIPPRLYCITTHPTDKYLLS